MMRARNEVTDAGRTIDSVLRLGLSASLAIWSTLLILPFAPIIVWSIVLTIALYPLYEWLVERLQGCGKLAAAILVVTALLIIVGPTTWLGMGLVSGVRTIMDQMSQGKMLVPHPPESVKDWPLIGSLAFDYWQMAATNLRELLSQFMPQIQQAGEWALDAAGNAGLGISKFLVSVIIAGFMFAPAPRFLGFALDLSKRISPKHGEEFLDLAGATIRAVSRGVIGVSLLQAAIAAIAMAFAGVPAASVLTLLILVFGIIQFGPWPIVAPLIGWAWFNLSFPAAALFIVCMIAVGLMENILKPIVMSAGLITPVPVTLIGVIGGFLLHGISGIFVGPVVLAVAWDVARTWLRDEKQEAAPATPERPILSKLARLLEGARQG